MSEQQTELMFTMLRNIEANQQKQLAIQAEALAI
jgi:hypothetical protein